MSVHIQYRFLKEVGDYLEDPKKTRGYTVVEANFQYSFARILREFYNDFKGRGVQICDIWRSDSYCEMEKERRMGDS